MAHILLIDDEKELCTAVRAVLQDAGHTVVEASDGAQGLNAYFKQAADLVICDLFMPEKEGLETIRELKKHFPDVRIIAISGGWEKFLVDCLPFAQKFGATRVLYKPLDMQTLLAMVEEVLAASSSRG